MARPLPPSVKAEAIRIRLQEQLSAPDIAKRLGISNWSAYKMLKKHTWVGQRRHRAGWTPAEIAKLRDAWPALERPEIEAALPGRTWSAISRHATKLGIRRLPYGLRTNKRPVAPICKALREAREAAGLSRRDLAPRCGYHVNQILSWETGKATPTLRHVTDWAMSLGLELKLVRPDEAPDVAPPAKDRLMGRR